MSSTLLLALVVASLPTAEAVVLDGSSTVFPIADLAARRFAEDRPDVSLRLGVSGTGGGFVKFCEGATDIQNASRPIEEDERARCAATGVRFLELPIAIDGVSVVVHPANDWVHCLTTEELARLWEPAAEGRVRRWSDLRADWPGSEVRLFGPGRDSGTFDFFTRVVVGRTGAARTDFVGSEDDYLLAQDVAHDPAALAFFGLAYYREYRDRLRLVAVDSGGGCILPDDASVLDGTYSPLSRPLYLYVSLGALEKESVRSFVGGLLGELSTVVREAGYLPLDDDLYSATLARFRSHTEVPASPPDATGHDGAEVPP